MNRIAEIIHIVPEERDSFLERELHRSQYTEQFLWNHGLRNQYYFKLGDLILMTFSYVGNNFAADMRAIQMDERVAKHFIHTRRKDVPEDQLDKVNWWAPLMKYGAILTVDPAGIDDPLNPRSLAYDESVYKFYWESDV